MSDKYSIYNLKGKKIISQFPMRYGGECVSGIVKKVIRNPLINKIEMIIGRKKYVFREPNDIIKDKDSIIFNYGENSEINDEMIIEEIKKVSNKGGGIDQALRNLDKNEVFSIKFEIKG